MNSMNGMTESEARETLASFRHEIDQIDYRLFRDAFPARRFDAKGQPLYSSLSLYGGDKRESLRKKGYRVELFDGFLLDMIHRMCVEGEYGSLPMNVFKADRMMQENLFDRLTYCDQIADLKKFLAGLSGGALPPEQLVRDTTREAEVIANAVRIGGEVGMDQGMATDVANIIMRNMRVKQVGHISRCGMPAVVPANRAT
jgi:chorismate mutase